MKVVWLLACVCLSDGRISEEGSAALLEHQSGFVLHAEAFESLESISHNQLVQLLHRLAATPQTVAQVRAHSISGADLASLSAADARQLLNCSTGQRCFQPRCPAPSVTGTRATHHNTKNRGGGDEVRAEDDPRESIAQVRAAARHMNPNLLEYARRHAGARRQKPSLHNRFVVWTCGCCGEPCSGWGNRMLGIVSALMLAVLTERTFLIHWPDDACADVAEYMGSEWIDWRMPKNFRHSVSPTDQEYLLNFMPFTGFEMSEKMRRFNPRELDSKAIIWMRASHGLFIDLWRNLHLSVSVCARCAWCARCACLRVCVSVHLRVCVCMFS